MADIDVVPKRRTNVWIWILLALVIVAVLFILVAAGRADASTTVQRYDRYPAIASPAGAAAGAARGRSAR